MESITQILARELDKKPEHIENVITLLDEGNTVPFIARYRKELHGGMDDTALRSLVERLEYLRSLQPSMRQRPWLSLRTYTAHINPSAAPERP